jgi:hypothetical protein
MLELTTNVTVSTMGRTSRTARSRLEREPEAEPCRQRSQQEGVRAAGHGLARPIERRRLQREGLQLGSVEHEHGAKKRLRLAWLLAALQVAFLDGDRRQDAGSPSRRS